MKVKILSLPKSCRTCPYYSTVEDRGHGYSFSVARCYHGYFRIKQGETLINPSIVHHNCGLRVGGVVGV